MKILLLFQFYLLRSTSALTVSDQLPSFSWLNGTDPLLKIRFPDGGHDVIRFHKTERLQGEDDDCIMSGEFEQEPDVSVTLTGGCVNSKDFEMTIVGSERLQHATYKITNGIAQAAGHHSNSDSVAFDDVIGRPNSGFGKKQHSHKPILRDSLPENIKLPIELYADAEFTKSFRTEERIKSAMTKIVGYAQAWFSDRNLRPVITLEPSFPEGWKYPKVMSNDLHSELDKVSAYVDKLRNINRPDGYPRYSVQDRISAFFGIQNFFQNIGGISLSGALCRESAKNKVSLIVEHWKYISKTGETLAHEIAHSLGISHDYSDETKNYYTDKSGKSCYTKGSLMDLAARRSTWSKCSIETLQSNILNAFLSCLKMSSNAS